MMTDRKQGTSPQTYMIYAVGLALFGGLIVSQGSTELVPVGAVALVVAGILALIGIIGAGVKAGQR